MDRGWLDRWWAEWLGCSPSRLREGGVVVADERDHVGVLLLAGAPAPVVYGPGRDLERLGRVGREEVERVLGPAWYGYVDRASLRPGSDGGDADVRPLGPEDAPALDRLRRATPPGEWDEAGMDGPAPKLGRFEGDELVAMSAVGDWRGVPSLGVLTHPAHRAAGHGAAVVRAAAALALERSPVVQYRALVTNRASLATAARIGVEHHLHALVVHLAG